MEFNLNSLLDVLEGNYELLNDIIDEIISEEYEEKSIGSMERYISIRDFEKLDKHIHKFMGSISYFKINSIDDILRRMKENSVQKNSSGLEEMFEELKIEFMRFKESLICCQNKLNRDEV